MRALVVGQGSIGRRHARVLGGMGCAVAVVTRGDASGLPADWQVWHHLDAALTGPHPDYIVVANETGLHHDVLRTLAEADYRGSALVEKPLFDAPCEVPPNRFRRLAVGYNLRFHPVLVELKRRLAGQKPLAVEAYAGQWLPDWRPGTDYRASYSAKRGMGGGVLRDLSHEFDLMQWLFGPWSRLTAIGGRRSALEIETDDLWTVLAELADGAAVTLHLNYLDRPGRRRITVITTDTTLCADLTQATLTENGCSTQFTVERDDTYRAEHAAMIADGPGEPCSADEGQAVLVTIAAIERAARTGQFCTAGVWQ